MQIPIAKIAENQGINLERLPFAPPTQIYWGLVPPSV